jgi:DinB family
VGAKTSRGADMPVTINQFRQLAAYNRWANARLYAAALDLSDQAYRLHIGVFFGNLHGTLNHLLLTDRLWLKRLTGEGEHPNQLNAILYEDRAELTRARIAEDNRLVGVVESTMKRHWPACTVTEPRRVCRNRKDWLISCCIYLITRPIIADRPTPAYRS